MSSEILLKAEKRVKGKSCEARRVRREGKVPAVVYGADCNMTISVDAREFNYMLNHHASEHVLVTLDVEGEKVSALLKDVQRNGLSRLAEHADFMVVVAGQMIHTTIPVALVGEAAGTKLGGVLECVTHALDVECLPKDLVEEFEVDVTALKIGDSITVAEVQALIGDKYTVLTTAESMVAHVVAPRVEEEVEEDDAAEVAAE